MAPIALGLALLSVGAAVVVAVRLARTERERTQTLGRAIEQSSMMAEAERLLLRSEIVREVESANRGRRRTETALVRVLLAALGIGIIGAASWALQPGPDGSRRTEAFQQTTHATPYVILALASLGLGGACAVLACLRGRRLSLDAQRRLLGRSGLLDRGQKSR